MSVKILADNLSQDEAFQLERKTIENYVFNQGYGIDIIGYNNIDNEIGHLTNCTFGGEGSYGSVHTEEWCKQHSQAMSGENNPMFGINVWDLYTDEQASLVRQKLSKSSAGENNPMFGISPKERMSENVYEEWIQKHRNMTGEKNPNYHNNTLKNKYAEHPELKQLLSRPGKQNGRSVPVFVYDLNMNYIRYFDYIGECCEWIQSKENKNIKINSIRTSIGKVLDTGKSYKKLLFFKSMQ